MLNNEVMINKLRIGNVDATSYTRSPSLHSPLIIIHKITLAVNSKIWVHFVYINKIRHNNQ